MLDKA